MEEGIVRLGRDDYDRLVGLWEASVRATHHFLREQDLLRIRTQMKIAYLPSVTLYGIEQDEELAAFMGIGIKKLEMLFVHPRWCGHGLGKRLVRCAVERFGAVLVDVNEQNTHAAEFYRRMGFREMSRDEADGHGRPYPILHMRWQDSGGAKLSGF